MSVLHVSIQHSNIVLTKSDPIALQEKSENAQEDAEGAANIYAISSVEGNVIYHVSNGQNDRVNTDKKWRKGLLNFFVLRTPLHLVNKKRN